MLGLDGLVGWRVRAIAIGGAAFAFSGAISATEHLPPQLERRAATTTEARALVVRVTVGVDQLDRLRQEFDVWAYARSEAGSVREAVIQVDDAGLKRLQSRGFKVRVDESETRLLGEMAAAREGSGLRVGEQVGEQGGEGQKDPSVVRGSGIAGFPCFRTVEETYADLSALAVAHPTLASWVDIGDSWEKDQDMGMTPGVGSDVYALVVTNFDNPAPKSPFIFLATTHAREYATAETATRFAEMLVNGYGVDAEITALLETTEVHIIPVHNPDGRKKAESMSPQSWRKNTNTETCAGSSSDGVDLNRNSTQFFRFPNGTCSGGGCSINGCTNTYSGPSANSEPETLAVDDYMATVFADQRGEGDSDAAPDDATGLMISVHSFGELVLYPWEAQSLNPPNHDQLRTLGRKFGHYLPSYDACQDCFGTAAGTNVDRAYGRFGVAAYTFEIGRNTFFPQCSGAGQTYEDDILPPVLDALLYAGKAARRPYQEPKGPEVIDVVSPSVPVPADGTIAVSGVADATRYSWDPDGSCGGSVADDCAPEPMQNVAAVYYSIDQAPWTLVTLDSLGATDGVYDAVIEPFSGLVSTAGLSTGIHLLYLVAEDASGQMGVPTVVFLEIDDSLFADGFESGDTGQWSSTS